MPPPELDAEADRLPVRAAHEWALDKLEIVRHYAYRFASACKNLAPVFYLVDGFAGPGINRIDEHERLVWGSPMLALRTEPRFAKVLCMDLKKKNVDTLSARAAAYERAIVLQGDTNAELVPAMEANLQRTRPCLCLALDPQHSEEAGRRRTWLR